MQTRSSTLDGVITTIVETLGIQDRADTLTESTPLFGSMPELDSLAVVEMATSLEERFGFYIEDDEFTGDLFETVGTLAAFVENKLASSQT
ncbi:acyl carrier protein [Intrasporangium sp.]|uniref:acyl carrier protein n=1 Tax=Intrasporangium sp. TaxID=1925024 RepID=UPI003221F5CE